jgi:uncharacterized protein DUF4380
MGARRWFVGMWSTCVLACGGPDRATRSNAELDGLNPAGAQRMEGDDEVQSGRAAEPALAPVFDAGRYVFRMGELELEVDPAIGGRITRFSLSGENVLTGPEVVSSGEGTTPNMWGSTFWTSPQSAWGWPPEVAIDAALHRARLDGDVLELESDPGSVTGYSVRKRFRADAVRKRVSIEYTLENQSAALPAAPWEISRVPKQGFVLFAAASPALPQSTLPSTFADGVAWVDISLAPNVDSKLFQDGSEGWIAYVHRDLVFLKTFEDTGVEDAAPSEAEIEVFVNGLYDYVEIEQQGRYVLPEAGGAQSWQVNWRLERLPAGVDARIGSAELVAWIRSLVASER